MSKTKIQRWLSNRDDFWWWTFVYVTMFWVFAPLAVLSVMSLVPAWVMASAGVLYLCSWLIWLSQPECDKRFARRAFWCVITPQVWAVWHLYKQFYPELWRKPDGPLSYKWMNVCHSAWQPNSFDKLWQYQWFGDPIEKLPAYVNLCGIVYKTVVTEGLVLFKADNGMTGTNIAMERDPHAKYSFMWYMNYEKTFQKVAMAHVERAYDWVKAVYGGSHEMKQAPLPESREPEDVYDWRTKPIGGVAAIDAEQNWLPARVFYINTGTGRIGYYKDGDNSIETWEFRPAPIRVIPVKPLHNKD